MTKNPGGCHIYKFGGQNSEVQNLKWAFRQGQLPRTGHIALSKPLSELRRDGPKGRPGAGKSKFPTRPLMYTLLPVHTKRAHVRHFRDSHIESDQFSYQTLILYHPPLITLTFLKIVAFD